MKNIFSSLLFVITVSNFVIGQTSNSNKTLSHIESIDETVYLHCNTTTLVSGESLYYKFYCLNPETKKSSSISKIGYIELLDSENKSLIKQKIALENGLGEGDFFISGNYKTGNYKLIAYTNWTQNKPITAIYKADIFLINPFETISPKIIDHESKAVSKKSATQEKLTFQSDKIDLTTDKKTYANREKVTLRLNSKTNENIKGSFSVSIRKIDSLPLHEELTAVTYSSSEVFKNKENQKKSTYFPELRGELISGKIISKNNASDINNKFIALSLPGKNFDLKVAKTNSEGKFHFILDRYPSTRKAILQVLEEKRNDYSVVLESDKNSDFSKLETTEAFAITPKMKGAIEERSVANQIENNFYLNKKDSLYTDPKTNVFFHGLEKNYILDDYNRFASLDEYIIELFSEMYTTRKNKITSIHVRDYQSKGETFGEPLVFIDGILLQNHEELFSYDMQNFYKLGLINKSYVYGPKLFDGLINFVTKTNNYEVKATGDFIQHVELQRPLHKKSYFQPNYTASKSDRIPDFRHQILWEPELKMEGSETSIDFYTSDVKGTFSITLEGFTEKGNPISIKEYIIVE